MARSPLDRSDFTDAADNADGSAVKSLRKALIVLNVVADANRPLTVAEVGIKSGIARPTAYRFVQTLVAADYLVQDPLDGRLSVGFAVLPLASSLLDRNRLRIEALPHLHALAQQTGERANLGILFRDCVLYIAGVEKPALPTIYSRFGKNTPAHCSSLGKAILAFLPEPEVRALLSRNALVAYTPNTITSRAAFMKELANTRARGYAIDNAEHVSGSCCVATPIFNAGNQPIGAIGVSGRNLGSLLKQHDLVRETAELVSHHLL
ncbi:MAG TPA: IclR family transcriptional regulator [Xanthobacteraceae bacterium]|jgi:DNA-binding IclR family transcriptional regulator